MPTNIGKELGAYAPLEKRLNGPWFAWLKPVARFFAWWFSFFVLLGPLSTCPFCGQSGCVGGIAGAGVLGGIAAGLRWVPRQIIRAFRGRRTTNEGSAE